MTHEYTPRSNTEQPLDLARTLAEAGRWSEALDAARLTGDLRFRLGELEGRLSAVLRSTSPEGPLQLIQPLELELPWDGVRASALLQAILERRLDPEDDEGQADPLYHCVRAAEELAAQEEEEATYRVEPVMAAWRRAQADIEGDVDDVAFAVQSALDATRAEDDRERAVDFEEALQELRPSIAEDFEQLRGAIDTIRAFGPDVDALEAELGLIEQYARMVSSDAVDESLHVLNSLRPGFIKTARDMLQTFEAAPAAAPIDVWEALRALEGLEEALTSAPLGTVQDAGDAVLDVSRSLVSRLEGTDSPHSLEAISEVGAAVDTLVERWERITDILNTALETRDSLGAPLDDALTAVYESIEDIIAELYEATTLDALYERIEGEALTWLEVRAVELMEQD